MYSVRLIHILLVALGFVAAAQATFLQNADTRPDAGLQLRQADESSGEPSGTPTGAPSPSGNGPDPSETPSQDPEETPTTTSNTPPTTPPTTTSQSETTNGPSPSDTESTAGPAPTSSDPEQSTTTGPATTSSQELSTKTTVTVIVSTGDNGDVTSFTTPATIVTTPSLSPDGDKSNDGGMPTSTRNIVIGVVCGVGGAIILGALGFVAWRVWGRKKRAEENDGLMDYHNTGASAFNTEPKPDTMSNSTGPSRSPFQTTLEDYHRPGQVNASSNF